MEKDVREAAQYLEAEALYKRLRQPGTGRISDAAEVHVSPDGQRAVFAGTLIDKLEGAPTTRICQVTLASGDTRVLTFGPNADRLPKYSPDGTQIAFISDRQRAGDFQLHLLDPVSGAARAAPAVERGWVEYLHWSPDGRRILLGVAGHGADISGGQGAVTSKQVTGGVPSWMPAVETGDEWFRWRRAWVPGRAGDPGLVTATWRQRPPSAGHECTWRAGMALASRLVGSQRSAFLNVGKTRVCGVLAQSPRECRSRAGLHPPRVGRDGRGGYL